MKFCKELSVLMFSLMIYFLRSGITYFSNVEDKYNSRNSLSLNFTQIYSTKVESKLFFDSLYIFTIFVKEIMIGQFSRTELIIYLNLNMGIKVKINLNKNFNF